MNKSILLTSIAALGMMFSLPVNADSSDQTSIEINADAEPVCFIASTPSEALNSGFNVISTAADKSVVELDNFIDSQTAFFVPGARALKLVFSDVYCNHSHTLSVQVANGGLVNITPGAGAVPGSGSFVSHLNYIISAELGGIASVSMTTDGTPLKTVTYTPDIPGAFRGQLDINVTIVPTPLGAPVLAGDYSDTATVQIGASL